MAKSKLKWEIYFISGLITLGILILGIIFGVTVSKGKVDDLQSQLDSLKMSQEDLNLEFALIATSRNQSCTLISYELDKVIDNAAQLGDRVSLYESNEKIPDQRFAFLKDDYTVTLIRYWFYLDQMKQECNRTNFITVLYFYSNNNCNDCDKQGLILNYLKQQYPQNVMNFAIDSDSTLSVVDLIKKTYQVQSVPTLVIDGKTYSGLVTTEDLKSILCEKIKC
jgi:thiol-disulfide isomerase/thioredoxin